MVHLLLGKLTKIAVDGAFVRWLEFETKLVFLFVLAGARTSDDGRVGRCVCATNEIKLLCTM